MQTTVDFLGETGPLSDSISGPNLWILRECRAISRFDCRAAGGALEEGRVQILL